MRSTLLAPGLQTFSAQAGLVRRNWGTASDEYGKMGGSALYRRGLTTTSPSKQAPRNAGRIPCGCGRCRDHSTLGVINFDVAGSGGSGSLANSFRWECNTLERNSISAVPRFLPTVVTGYCVDERLGRLRKQITGFTGLNLRRLGTAGVAYAVWTRMRLRSPAQHSDRYRNTRALLPPTTPCRSTESRSLPPSSAPWIKRAAAVCRPASRFL